MADGTEVISIRLTIKEIAEIEAFLINHGHSADFFITRHRVVALFLKHHLKSISNKS